MKTARDRLRERQNGGYVVPVLSEPDGNKPVPEWSQVDSTGKDKV